MPSTFLSQTSDSQTNILVLFDFDGTITRKDTLLDFIKFYRGNASFYAGMLFLLPTLVALKLRLIPNWRAKERVLMYFIGGTAEKSFRQTCHTYARQRLPSLIKDSALQKIRAFQAQGADVYLVSASAEHWLTDWCQSNGLHLIATRLEVQAGVLTGKIAGKNCYGSEKAHRIRQEVDLSRYDTIYGYGDSRGDREMLQLAHIPHYRFFK